ncbi:M23 family metallopeptidase [Sphingomonas panacisoli]|uniref:M23 family metallopeptidase n=1 Tax=Sphingomonas panacisoli TaxID=1813879 RepID=A0A5B8LL21_9SPHN|nr:M23 family metallopeptidase [Sphingomonas panacisoli]QDZ08435.1 M23 family metallopeptidase [Sphingomonas panacisoli]
MKRARRWVAGFAVLIASGSCVEAAPAPQALPPAVIVTPTRPVPKAPPVPLGDFVLKGSLIQGGLVLGMAPAGTSALMLDGAPVPIAADGSFVIAFDRDARPVAMLEARSASGETISRTLSISPRAWAISRLATLPKFPVPPADFDRIRPGEIAQINAARKVPVDSQGWRQPFLWPATGRISTLFGSQRIYRNGVAGAYHSGIDIAVPQGTPVLAPADGVVTLASDHAFLLEGNLLLVAHGMGVESAFMHLSRILVSPGQRVLRGQVIAYSGATGRVTGAHLHWSLRWWSAKIDPLLVAGPMSGTR